ncbi:MAG: tRNA (adenosine(37)-N6)-threonylcarbamoyltransferase complex ATPase subunit type 1 TsaE, partial [Limosilactobacillus sp.]
FKRTDADNTRVLEFEPHGQHFSKLVQDVVA